MIVNNVKNLLLIILGNFILAFAVGFFILPFHILSGGVAGVAVALSPLINVPSQTIVVGLIVSLFLLGCIFLGKEFAMKTILSSVLYPVFFRLYRLMFVLSKWIFILRRCMVEL